MTINKLYIILMLLFFNSIISCKKQENNFFKNNNNINKKLVTTKILEDTLPSIILEKYKSQKYFNSILKNNKALIKDIKRIFENKTGIEYKERVLDKNLVLCQFIFLEEVQYDYYYNNEKLIYKEITPINKANYNFEYKDWNGDEKPEIITNYEQFEGGGGLAYYKTKSIYELKDDTILKIVSLPIENIICQLGEVSSIDEYKYKFNSKKNELTITKTTGIGDCNKNKIKTIQSKKTKTVIIKKHDNGVISFD